MAFCIQCGHPNPEEGRFCDHCGKPLVWGVNEASRPKISKPSVQVCPACKKPSASEKFCTSCGHKFVAVSTPEPELALAEPLVSPAVDFTAKPQDSGEGEERKAKSRLMLGVGIALVLVALGAAAYVIMGRSSSEPSPPLASAPAPTIEAQPAASPAESKSAPAPLPASPLATESPPAPVVVAPEANPAPPAAVPAEPRTPPVRPKPVRQKPVPPVKEKERPAPPPPTPSMAEKPARQDVKKQFSCSDLPFGLLVACGVEGKDVIRKCAPDLKNWNHNIPGCNRQGGATNN